MAENHGHNDAHGRNHHRQGGWLSALWSLVAPHSHDPAESVDRALEGSTEGTRVLGWSLLILAATAAIQGVVVLMSGSVALLGDTLHNASDALTAIPLLVAFNLGRRSPTRRFTYGLGRAEDVAGLFAVVLIALSAALAAWEAVQRLLHPHAVDHLPYVMAAAVVGLVGNEVVAGLR